MAAPNVWTQMSYVPPRGQCNYRQSVISKCPCLRFMLHPLKSASSYECDGCSHHASFHSLENKVEDEIRKRWEQEAKDKADNEKEVQQRGRKRPRLLEGSETSRQTSGATGLAVMDFLGLSGQTAARGRSTAKKPARAAATKARGEVIEIVEDAEE